MKYTAFHEQRFRNSVSKALKQVQTILDTTRNPVLAEDDADQHKYDDKYALAEFLTNTSIASQMNALERLGLEAGKLAQVVKWVNEDKRTVSLRFQAKDSCKFLKEQEVDVVSQQREAQVETTTASTPVSSSGLFGSLTGGSSASPSAAATGTASSKTEKFQSRVVQKVKEYHWKVEVEYRLIVYCGNKPDDLNVELMARNTSAVLITSGGQAPAPRGGNSKAPNPPIPEGTSHPPIDVNLTWFFKMISPEDQVCRFAIDRDSPRGKKTCRTPRRNANVKEAVEFNKALYDWCNITRNFFLQRMEKDILLKHQPVEGGKPSVDASKKSTPSAKSAMPLEPGTRCTIVGLQKEPTFNGKGVMVREVLQEQDRYRVEPVDRKASGLPNTLLIKAPNLKVEALPPSATSAAIASTPSLSAITTSSLFCPVLPLMENGSVLSMGDVSEFLSEQVRAIDEMTDGLAKSYPPRQLVKLVSLAEATVVVMSLHLQDLALSYNDSLDYIEDMLKKQLCQAIGKEIHAKDFDQFMRFHNQKLFAPQFAPKPFSYAIRRSAHHYPDGILTIEGTREKNDPVETLSRYIKGEDGMPISVPINASTSVQITGDRYLHGWIQHRFRSKPRNEFRLIARARQFSSFLLIVGTMAGADKFDAKDAIILQNKDEVLIPLLCNVLPTAKEFKDAIASLSPEQKAFAESFRTMQLESSVFGVCIVQLKPQLEKLLGLPDGALTKEIQLTQDLMSLFVDYQIPSDLLALDGVSVTDGATDGDVATKVASVKGFVKSVMDVIDGSKEKQLLEETRKADMRGEMNYTGTEGVVEPDVNVSVEEEHVMLDTSENSFMSQSSGGSRSERAQLSPRGAARLRGRRLGAGAARRTAPVGTARLAYAAPPPMAMAMAAAEPSGGQVMEAVKAPTKPSAFAPKDLSLESTECSEDFTLIPKILDAKLEKHDSDNALRSTIIKAGQSWTRNRQENLLTPMKAESLSPAGTEAEKKKAFDMLDAISRSGTLPIECSELHVVVAVSHCFDNDVMGTIIQDNINPIEKVEKSALMIGSAIFGEGPSGMIENEDQVKRLTAAFPMLFREEPQEKPKKSSKTKDITQDDSKPSDPKTSETKPSESKTSETKPSDPKTSETKPSDTKPAPRAGRRGKGDSDEAYLVKI